MLGQATSASHGQGDARAGEALRRALLVAARPGAPLQDQIDCVPLAAEAGLGDLAEALRALSALQLGSRRGAELFPASGADPARAMGPVAPGGFAFDIAVAELAALLTLRVELAEDAGTGAALAEALPGTPAGVALDPAVRALADEVLGELARRSPGSKALRRLMPDLLALAPIAIDQHVASPVELIGALHCLETMRRFVVANGDLLGARSDSGSAFEAAAALDAAALGPYFTNMRLLIRSVRDIFALIDAAADRAADKAVVETWCVLLSAHLAPHQLADLVDELGDRGMVDALHRLLSRIARAGTFHRFSDAVRRIRDVALDLRLFPLAAEAQRMIAQARRADSNEWKILGDIEANAGADEAAKAAYDRSLFVAPFNADARRNMSMAALGTPPTILGGFEVPEGRRQLRRARAEAYQAARSPA